MLPIPDVHNADGTFRTIGGEPVDTAVTKLALDVQLNIYRMASAAAFIGLELSQRITLIVNAEIAKAIGNDAVQDHRAFYDGSICEKVNGLWHVVADGTSHDPPRKVSLAQGWCEVKNPRATP